MNAAAVPAESAPIAGDDGGREEEMLARADALWLVGKQGDAQALVTRVLAE